MPSAVRLTARPGGGLETQARRREALGAARAIGRTDLGTIREGAIADLLVLDGSLLDRLDVVRRPAAVVLGGRLVRADPASLGEACPAGLEPYVPPPAIPRTLDIAWTLLRALHLRT